MKISVVRSETPTSSRSLPDSQWGEARLSPRANSLHYLLQHDASTSHRRSQRRRWHLDTIPHWWQPIQLAALQAYTKTLEHTENALQCITSCFTEEAQLFGLEASLKKTRFSIIHPTLQLARENKGKTSSSSPTWGAPSPQTQKSTKRWITDWQRQTVLSADSTVVSGAASTWRKPQNAHVRQIPVSAHTVD